MSVTNVSRAVRRVFEHAGLYESQNSVLHLIRHTVATRLVTSGVDLETARDVLGHVDVSTTASTSAARTNARRQLRRSWRSDLEESQALCVRRRRSRGNLA